MKDYERIACEMLGVDNPIDLPIKTLEKLRAVNALCEKAAAFYAPLSGGFGGPGPNGRLVSRQTIAHIIVETV